MMLFEKKFEVVEIYENGVVITNSGFLWTFIRRN